MRVAFIIDAWDPIIGGGQVYVWEVAQRLVKKHGCQVDILTRALRDDYGNAKSEREEHFDGKLRILRFSPVGSFGQTWLRLWFLKRVFWYLLWHRYDILNPQSILPGWPAWLIGKLKKVPVILTVHGTALFLPTKNLSLRQRVERWIESFVLTKLRYSKEITVARNFTALPNVNKDIAVIPNGVDVEKFERVNIEKTQYPSVLFVGRFDWIKGVDLLLRAWPQVVRQVPNAKLRLVGYGFEESKLRQLTHEQGIESSVEFLGKLTGEKLVKIYKSSHVFLLPSRSEGQPLTLLEAWAAQLPTVITDVADNKLFFQKAPIGNLVPPEQPEILGKAIIETLEKSATNLQGYEIAKKEYSWDTTTQKLFTAYQVTQ